MAASAGSAPAKAAGAVNPAVAAPPAAAELPVPAKGDCDAGLKAARLRAAFCVPPLGILPEDSDRHP